MTRVDNTVEQPANPGPLSDEEAQALAKAIYVRMPVVRLTDVAKRVGRSKETIESWQRAGRWLEERANKREVAEAENLAKLRGIRVCTKETAEAFIRELQGASMIRRGNWLGFSVLRNSNGAADGS